LTLVLTELSSAGISMAADSAITTLRNGRIVETDRIQWNKLLKVPKIRAAISYWGMIGAVSQQQFDVWLQNVIDSGNYANLDSFADHLVERLNTACHNKPLKNGYDVGIHVAGFHKWPDGKARPFFYHVHNGHGRIKLNEKRDSRGRTTYINPTWDSDPRGLFEKHQDFPKATATLQKNLVDLDNVYIIRNGDFFLYAVFQDAIRKALHFINLSPKIRLPSNPANLASRKGFLHVVLESMIRLYRCSNQSRVVGGTVRSLGITANRYII
jgi:hypothetical protein